MSVHPHLICFLVCRVWSHMGYHLINFAYSPPLMWWLISGLRADLKSDCMEDIRHVMQHVNMGPALY